MGNCLTQYSFNEAGHNHHYLEAGTFSFHLSSDGIGVAVGQKWWIPQDRLNGYFDCDFKCAV